MREGRKTYVPSMITSRAPQHGNELHELREAIVHVRVPVVSPVYLGAAAIPVLDIV